MIRALVLCAGLLAAALPAAGAARAQDARPEASPEMLQAALQAAVVQRDQALNDGLRVSAQLTLAQREIARLRREAEAARAQPDPQTR